MTAILAAFAVVIKEGQEQRNVPDHARNQTVRDPHERSGKGQAQNR
jgi:hypothetical protein